VYFNIFNKEKWKQQWKYTDKAYEKPDPHHATGCCNIILLTVSSNAPQLSLMPVAHVSAMYMPMYNGIPIYKSITALLISSNS
jgi:hypothetical protein